jgi:hypothetical protein
MAAGGLWWVSTSHAPEAQGVTADDPEGRLAAECRQTAEWLGRALGGECCVVVKPPFVLAGDLSEAELEAWHRETIRPAARAMAAAYFKQSPQAPITILLLSSEDRYRHYAAALFGDRPASRYGYFRPHLRTVVINAGSGNGPVLHELTHALMACDFPDAPAWLNEGLAALHERAEVRPDGSGIDGRPNGRLAVLQEALRQGRLPPLQSLLQANDFHGPQERLRYAQARCFCLYLQHQGVLGEVYRAVHAGRERDPSGSTAVMHLLSGRTWEELDADFRRFAARLGTVPFFGSADRSLQKDATDEKGDSPLNYIE